MEAGQNRKDEVFWKILNAAIELDFKRGHLRWSISDLSRSADVTRSLIYYYFGKSKNDILVAAVQVIGDFLFGLSGSKLELWRRGETYMAVSESRRTVQEHPALAGFYLAHRFQNSEISSALQELEEKYLAKLKAFYPTAGEQAIISLFAVFFGLVFTPGVTEESLRLGVSKAVALIEETSG